MSNRESWVRTAINMVPAGFGIWGAVQRSLALLMVGVGLGLLITVVDLVLIYRRPSPADGPLG